MKRAAAFLLVLGCTSSSESAPADQGMDTATLDGARAYAFQRLVGKTDSRLPPDLFIADGHDGQFIYVVPSLDLVVVRNGHYDKYEGPPVATPTLFARYPPSGLSPGAGTVPPDSWDHYDFLSPILASIH